MPNAVAGPAQDARQLVASAEALRPLLERNAEETERLRRLPDENVQALTEAGVFLTTVPRRFGGYESSLRTKLEVSAAVAEGCGSSAWVVTLINVCNWMASLYAEEAQQEVFGSGAPARVAGVLAPSATSRRVDGGLVVSGRWPWASGSLHSTHAEVGVPVVDDAGQCVDQGLALIPRDEVTIEDTWFVAGMRGTGSNTIVADEVFVPDHRVLSISAALRNEYATPHKDEVPYRSSFIPVLALVLVGPQLGLGRAALEHVLAKAPRRAIASTKFERQTDSTAFTLAVSEAAMRIDTAHLHAFRAADDIDRAAEHGEDLDYVTRARVRADTGYSARLIREAIDLLISAHGASSFAEVSPLQRIWRDSNTAGRHAVVNPAVNAEVYGRALLGTEQITELI